MRFIDSIRHKVKEKLQLEKGGGELLMFGDELIIGGIRAQSEHLKRIVNQLECDEKWRENSFYYAKELHNVEKALRMIRKKDFESLHIYETCGA